MEIDRGSSVDVTFQVGVFRSFMLDCWPGVSSYLRVHDWDDDPYFLDYWLQANWELIMERQLLVAGEFLEPYSNLSGTAVRYSHAGAGPTHVVVCVAGGVDGEASCGSIAPGNDLVFCSLVTREGGAVGVYPPFDLVEAKVGMGRQAIYLPFDSLSFRLCSIL